MRSSISANLMAANGMTPVPSDCSRVAAVLTRDVNSGSTNRVDEHEATTETGEPKSAGRLASQTDGPDLRSCNSCR